MSTKINTQKYIYIYITKFKLTFLFSRLDSKKIVSL